MAANPGQEVEAGVLALVEHEVQEHAGDPFPLEEDHGLGRGGGRERLVAEVVEVDPQLVLHRALVLDDQHHRAQHLGRAVDLQAWRQGREPDLARGTPRLPSHPAVLQGLIYMKLN